VDAGRVSGVNYLDAKASGLKHVAAGAVLLATGGLGHVYKETTNPAIACGDGMVMAYRAGALLSDMEFVQFHPTALSSRALPGFFSRKRCGARAHTFATCFWNASCRATTKPRNSPRVM
jgi:L-aspartate oxidase